MKYLGYTHTKKLYILGVLHFYLLSLATLRWPCGLGLASRLGSPLLSLGLYPCWWGPLDSGSHPGKLSATFQLLSPHTGFEVGLLPHLGQVGPREDFSLHTGVSSLHLLS